MYSVLIEEYKTNVDIESEVEILSEGEGQEGYVEMCSSDYGVGTTETDLPTMDRLRIANRTLHDGVSHDGTFARRSRHLRSTSI